MHDLKLREILQRLRRQRQGAARRGRDHVSAAPRVGLVGDRGIARKIARGLYPYEPEDEPGG